MSALSQSIVENMSDLSLDANVETIKAKNIDCYNKGREYVVDINKEGSISLDSNSEYKRVSKSQETGESSIKADRRGDNIPSRGCCTMSPNYDLHGRCSGPIDDSIPSRALDRNLAAFTAPQCTNSHNDYLREFNVGISTLARWTIGLKEMQDKDRAGFEEAINAFRSRRGEDPLGEWAGKINFMLNVVRDVRNEIGQEPLEKES